MDVDYEIDVDDINRRWAQASSVDVWSQLVLKDTGDDVERLTAAPRTGVWRIDDAGAIAFARWGNDWHSLHDETEAFFLRVLAAGRLPLSGRGPRRARGALADADRRQPADRARPRVDPRDPRRVRRRAGAEGGPPPHAGVLAFKTA